MGKLFFCKKTKWGGGGRGFFCKKNRLFTVFFSAPFPYTNDLPASYVHRNATRLHEESDRFSGEAGRDCETEIIGRWWEGGGPSGDPPYWFP